MIDVFVTASYSDTSVYIAVTKTLQLPGVPRLDEWLEIIELNDEYRITEVHWGHHTAGISVKLDSIRQVDFLAEDGWTYAT